MYRDKAENIHFWDTWTNIYYPNPRTTKDFQSLYANVPHFKDFLKLHQKVKFLCLEIQQWWKGDWQTVTLWKGKHSEKCSNMQTPYFSWDRLLPFSVIAKPVPTWTLFPRGLVKISVSQDTPWQPLLPLPKLLCVTGCLQIRHLIFWHLAKERHSWSLTEKRSCGNMGYWQTAWVSC